jgi:hypothetical protein
MLRPLISISKNKSNRSGAVLSRMLVRRADLKNIVNHARYNQPLVQRLKML